MKVRQSFMVCPIGNLIVELSTEDENFRCPLNDFMTQWTEKLASLLPDLHADWSEERSQLQARQVISSIQGSIVILKVSQDIQVLENNMTDLKRIIVNFSRRIKSMLIYGLWLEVRMTTDIKTEIGHRVRQKRERHKLTREEVCGQKLT